jgi:hypothetical protein
MTSLSILLMILGLLPSAMCPPNVLTEETQNGWLTRLRPLAVPNRMWKWHQKWLEGPRVWRERKSATHDLIPCPVSVSSLTEERRVPTRTASDDEVQSRCTMSKVVVGNEACSGSYLAKLWRPPKL